MSSADLTSGESLFIRIGDGEMAVRRYGLAGAEPLLFAHANGFCASAYRRMFEAMGETRDVFAIDLRGFGRSRLPADPTLHKSMDVFGADIRFALDVINRQLTSPRPWTLAGHSLGAVSVTLAAVGRPDIASLRLIEPVATPRWLSLLARTPVWPQLASFMPLVKAARGRRATFPDRNFVQMRYGGKSLFKNFAPGVLDDYLMDGLRAGSGGVELSCAPAWEASVFAGQAHDFWGAVRDAPASLSVLAARDRTTTAPPSALARLRRLGAKIELVEGLSHLIPFEDPARAAVFLTEK